jgi:U3 small nucleolar RNA-associated protein 18
MSRTTTKVRSKASREFQIPEIAEQPLVKLQDEESEGSDRSEDDADMEEDGSDEEIDEDEKELERLLFGDSAGFREGLRNLDDDEDEEESGAEDEATGLEGVDDAAVSGE